MDEVDRQNVETPINGCEWPVPMPKGADLNHIRIEMLNIGAEYVWLDVLCLRQAGGRGGASACGGVEGRCAENRVQLCCYTCGVLLQWAWSAAEVSTRLL